MDDGNGLEGQKTEVGLQDEVWALIPNSLRVQHQIGLGPWVKGSTVVSLQMFCWLQILTGTQRAWETNYLPLLYIAGAYILVSILCNVLSIM